jgi:hypothetical protein
MASKGVVRCLRGLFVLLRDGALFVVKFNQF